jgi:hypothetical protein
MVPCLGSLISFIYDFIMSDFIWVKTSAFTLMKTEDKMEKIVKFKDNLNLCFPKIQRRYLFLFEFTKV